MAGVLDAVDQRTRLAGQNRLELLLFKLKGRQIFGINVFKIQEVIQCPPLNHMPRSNPVISGVANMRGRTIPVIDLSLAIGRSAIEDRDNAYVIVSEFNRKVQGFLVGGVDRIINLNWEEVLPAPKVAGKQHYLTAVTRVEGEIVEIIDVEKVLAEVIGETLVVSNNILDSDQAGMQRGKRIMVVDDSSVARNQIRRTLEQLGIECIIANDGRQALDMLKEMASTGPIKLQLDMLISDVEMPEMDGYTLTSSVRKDDRLKDLFIVLHTSLSGVFNESMVKSVGADRFIAKFNADDLANFVLEQLGCESEVEATG
ncbi:chemotaxis protein CheV [Sulfuriflexus sp.]|uniref:chemotaxis protein CheV n=1 Tax=Sulfuriflexus sp. TaxID=2015443 RepID=UPI0028CD10B0|nr:chemotaxis protein CheV [Sulfuriflexus sp.]MDT8404494.1 chemotaxis protein CheV [Sulfuriflexus sp.]